MLDVLDVGWGHQPLPGSDDVGRDPPIRNGWMLLSLCSRCARREGGDGDDGSESTGESASDHRDDSSADARPSLPADSSLCVHER